MSLVVTTDISFAHLPGLVDVLYSREGPYMVCVDIREARGHLAGDGVTCVPIS